MFCVGYGIYTRELCIFRNQYKTLDNLFSPDPAVSFADIQASHREIHIMQYFVAFHLGVCHFFSNGCVQMGQMDFISCISFRFFAKIFGKRFTYHTSQVYMRISYHCFCILL